MTAPMGVMQMVQTPLPPPSTPTPQVSPAAARLLASAVQGTPTTHAALGDRKPLVEAPSNQPRGGGSQPDQHTQEAEAPDATTQRLLTSVTPRREPPRLAWPSDASFAAQLMAQEDMAEMALPAQSVIADMLKRMAEKKTQNNAQVFLAARQPRSANEAAASASSQTPVVQSSLRRDVNGAVQVPRGAGAYAQASARMAKLALTAALPTTEMEQERLPERV